MSKDETQIRKQLQRLAVQECANYMDGMCVEEDRPCHVLLPQYTIHDGAIGCDYFLEAVLPLDKELNRVVWAKIDEPHWAPWIVEEDAETGAQLHHCCECGKVYRPASNRQKYCLACGKAAKRKRDAQVARNAYHSRPEKPRCLKTKNP